MRHIDLTWVAEYLPVRFYTNTLPRATKWPFVLVHLEDYTIRLPQYSNFAKHIILDIHVHRFRHCNDYPLTVIKHYYLIIRKIAEKYRDRISFVLPDLPWDPSYFEGSKYHDNVRKTYRYHIMFLKYTEDVCRRTGSQVILVVQHRQSLHDAERSCIIVNDLLTMLRDESIVYAIGVGSLCVNKSAREIARYIQLVAGKYPHLRVHGFGVKLNTIDYLPSNVLGRYSFDSTSWTRPVCTRVQKILGVSKRWGCKDETERQIYFVAFIARLAEKLSQHALSNELWRLIEKMIHGSTSTSQQYVFPRVIKHEEPEHPWLEAEVYRISTIPGKYTEVHVYRRYYIAKKIDGYYEICFSYEKPPSLSYTLARPDEIKKILREKMEKTKHTK